MPNWGYPHMIGFPFPLGSGILKSHRMRACLIFLLSLLATFPAFAELVVGKPEWGFDGTGVTDSFNILTVEVRNTGGQPFEGTLTLDDGGRFGGRQSAPYHQSIYVAPGAARAVQFYPFLPRYSNGFRILWKEQGGGTVAVDVPKASAPAIVLLVDFDAPNLRALRMRAFNEAHFPPTVSATDGLHAVVLDHQPRWDLARREAFLDWVKRGGLVHLIHGPDGNVPEFTGELSALNVPGARGLVGAGLVVKHAIPRTEVTSEFLRDAGFPAPSLRQGSSNMYYTGDSAIFRRLSQVTKPKIAWGIIYTLTIVYVALVGPVFYILRRRDYRALLGGFIGTVALFAWAFTVIGRRGYGEKQIYHTQAVARSIEGAKWDVRHWVHAFATSGDTYRFSFPGTSHLYAAVSQEDTVRGDVVQGREASFTADIPLFSSRPFIHQGVMTGPHLAWEILEFEGRPDSSNTRGKFRLKPGFKGEVLSVVAQYGSEFYRLNFKEDWEIGPGAHQMAQRAFGTEDGGYDYYYYREAPEVTMNRLRSSPFPLVRSMVEGVDGSSAIISKLRQREQIRLFTYASAPEAFSVESKEFQSGIGLVLFVQDLIIPPKPNP